MRRSIQATYTDYCFVMMNPEVPLKVLYVDKKPLKNNCANKIMKI